MEPIDLVAKLEQIEGLWSPRIVGYFNDCKLQLVKVQGEFLWHSHPETDDFFLVLAGRLTIELRDDQVVLGPGQVFVVPRGVEHRPRADEETHVLLIEPRGTPNTGDAEGATPAPEIEL